MKAKGSPHLVKNWTKTQPVWLDIRKPKMINDSISLGIGEQEAISLASEMSADLVLIDDRKARQAAIESGLKVAGTINVLESASKRKLVNLDEAFDKLQKTNFRIAAELLEDILKRN